MRKIIAAAALMLAAMVVLAGCAPLSGLFGSGEEARQEPLLNGTTTGNILNGGFAVKDGDDLLFYYTGSVYSHGSLVRSNPDTGENSLVHERAGIYMNLVDGMLYYCLEDGIYRTSLDAPAPERVLAGSFSLLQIADGRLYFISDGAVSCAATDGSDMPFTPIQNAACLNVYGEKLYFLDSGTGFIRQADMDGSHQTVLFDKPVDMFYIIDDVIYFIDSADGQIKRMTLELKSLETVVKHPCSGFNVNRSGMYYTRTDDGLCYNAGPDGLQETVIDDFGESTWHRVCMFGGGALVLRQEDMP